MQVERIPTDEEKKFFEARYGQFPPTVFEWAKEFNQSEMEKRLEDPDVKEVHVFKATRKNLQHANLRQQFPGATRKQLRGLIRDLNRAKKIDLRWKKKNAKNK